MLLLLKISNPLVNEVQTSNSKVIFRTWNNIFDWQIQKGLLLVLSLINWLNTNTNTQERVVSYAMCVHWLDMLSPLLARPTIPMAIPSPKLAIQQPFYASEPILQYGWNSRFHTQVPLWSLHIFRGGVCLIHGGIRQYWWFHTCGLVFAEFVTIGPK